MGKTTIINKKHLPATFVFSQWAEQGKDEGMENGHTSSVNFMFKKIVSYFNKSFSALDVGCGNGWVVRKFNELENCKLSVGIDGAKKMIEKAKAIDTHNQYVCENLLTWSPKQTFDIIHSMEVLYYLENPSDLIKTIYTSWLEASGCFIFGIDHYEENKSSINWPTHIGVSMNTQPIEFWISIMQTAGFKNIKHWQTGAKENWLGTLVVFGEK